MTAFDIATWDAVVYPPDSDTETRFRPVNLAILALARAGLISVTVSETAPGDTSVIWLDPALNDNANGAVKIHNGTSWVTATKALLLRHLGGITQADVDAEIAAVVGTATEAFDSFGEIVTALNGKADSVHTHSQAQVTNLVTDLAAKQPLSSTLTTLAGATAAGLALMDDANAAAQRATLGISSPGDAMVTAATAVAQAQLVGRYETRTAAAAAIISAAFNVVQTLGYVTAGDGGGAYYKRVGSEPSHAGKFQSADGAWWALSDQNPDINVKQFGAVGDGVHDDAPEIQNAISYVETIASGSVSGQAKLRVPKGEYWLASQLDIADTIVLEGDGQFASGLRRSTGTVLNVTGDNVVIRDLFFPGSDDASTGTTAIYLSTANGAIIERNYFQNFKFGVYFYQSYGCEVVGNVFDVGALHGIYANTSAHNMMVERNGFFSVGGTTAHAIKFEVGSDNVGIKDNDFEYGGGAVAFVDCTAVEFTGNYVEYQTIDAIYCGGTCYGVKIECNWIALGSSDGATLSIGNIVGGTFKFNRIYNQTVSFNASTLSGFDVGLNRHTGTGSVGSTPWIAPTLVNSWAQQTNYTEVGYIKDSKNWVHLRGGLVSGVAPNTLFTLPSGYRPANIMVFGTDSASGPCRITVNPDGTVVPTVAASNNACLDGIAFYVG